VLRPEPDDGFAFKTPFAVLGRSTRELIIEFGDEESAWNPETGRRYSVRVQAQIHPSDEWVDVVTFGWWAPPTTATLNRYIAYANSPA